MRKYVFNPGPATLPTPVLERVRDELLDYKGLGYSILEASHRSKEYSEVHEQAMELLRELLQIPNNYKILFLGGGATLQFSMIPLNLLKPGSSCDFTLTGSWSKKAYADAKKVGNVNVVYDGEEHGYTRMPKPSEIKVSESAAYLHITSNETIQGIEWHQWPETGNVPIVADMSSDILSRPLPIEKFGLIYAGAQKNLGPAGVTVVIIRDDLLEQSRDDLTAYLSYKTHASKNSIYNTPPVFAVYIMKLVLEWVKEIGGMQKVVEMANERAKLVYDAIDSSGGFYNCPVEPESRSKMNVVFRLPNKELEEKFLQEAAKEGMVGLKGHRSVGGCRASLYNAMPVEGARKLAEFMKEFARKYG